MTQQYRTAVASLRMRDLRTGTIPIVVAGLIMVVGLALSAEDAVGHEAEGHMHFVATKDLSITAYAGGGENEQMGNAGLASYGRALRQNQDVTIMDFDTVAMGDFLAANPGTATWTLNILYFDGTLPAAGNDPGIMTVESLNDWAEGDGEGAGLGSYNWTQGTAAATYFYAQAVHDPNNVGTLDVVNSLEWIDPDSGPYTFTVRNPEPALVGVPSLAADGNSWDRDPTPAFTNTASFTSAQLAADAGVGNFSSIVIDEPIVNALINDPNNRGLRFGPVYQDFNVMRIFSKDQAGGLDLGPFLEVTITPGTPGDFDFDGDVDGADFLEWQRDTNVGNLADWEANFGTGGGSLAASSAIPEPSSLLLLLAGASVMLGIRRSKL